MRSAVRIIPIGYSLTRSGRTVGTVFGLLSGGLAAAMLALDGGIIAAMPFIVTAAVFLAGGFLSDFTVNRKARPRIASMNELLALPDVPGRIISSEMKDIRFGMKRERDWKEGIRAKSTVRRFRVSYRDPYDGTEREAVSEAYCELALLEKPKGRMCLEPCYDKEYARVHAAPDGKTWVELIYKRPD